MRCWPPWQVFMGMGEPLANMDAVLAAVDIMCHPQGLQLSHRKVRKSAQPALSM